MFTEVDIVVAGHICLDIIPTLNPGQTRAEDIFVPGRLFDVGPATVSLGGAVANAGGALHRLGFASRLMGKVGADLLGQTTLECLRQYGSEMANGMIVAEGEASSYTIVLSPPGVDRCFLHCPATNATFVAADVSLDAAASGRIFHFGYPPLMRGMFVDGGVGLSDLFGQVRGAGSLTSLDMAVPDLESDAGKVDWRRWLENVLPRVDVFAPSFDEILLMLDKDRYDDLSRTTASGNLATGSDTRLLSSLSGQLLKMGVSIVVLKLGDQGVYLRTCGDLGDLADRSKWADFDWRSWSDRELLAPCFRVDVAGTNGSGDCTVAGFLGAMVRGHNPTVAVERAVAVGACNVESPDATSGIPPWGHVERRIQEAWPRRDLSVTLAGWNHDESTGIWSSPGDRKRP